MEHLIARCNSGTGSQNTINSAFEEAQSTNGPVIYCWYTHKRSNMQAEVATAHGYLDAASLAYDVPFKYATAQESTRAITGSTDTTPPALTISGEGDVYTITSDEQLWGDHPYVAARYGDIYTHASATAVGDNTWQVTLPAEMTVTTPPESYALAATAQNEQSDHPASHAVDGNSATYWDSSYQEAPVWIQVDLGEVKDVARLSVHFYDGDSRQYTYYVEASDDGSTWTEIVPSNTVHGLATHDFDPALSMRYARVTVTANSSSNNYAHVREIALYSATETGTETFYLQEVGAAGVDLGSNSAVVTLAATTSQSAAASPSAAPNSQRDLVPVAVAGVAVTSLLGAAWWLLRRKLLLV
jgi:hypothetical protein